MSLEASSQACVLVFILIPWRHRFDGRQAEKPQLLYGGRLLVCALCVNRFGQWMCDRNVCLLPLVADVRLSWTVPRTNIVKQTSRATEPHGANKIATTTATMEPKWNETLKCREWELQFLREKDTKSTHTHTEATHVIALPFNECKINSSHRSFNELYLSMIWCVIGLCACVRMCIWVLTLHYP